MDDMTNPEAALGWIAARRALVEERLAGVETRLAAVRSARGDWIDEEHDPEGFALTFEWQQAEGSRADHIRELAELDAAEARVHAGGYGMCASCGRAIPDAQLELRPARTVCVACADRRP
jgi:RNA polymerase-binding transcription factor DksA